MSAEIEPFQVAPAEWFGDRRESYDRMDDESREDFLIFEIYRGLGVKRSIKAAAQKAEVSVNSCAELSRRYSWPSRALCFDDAIDRQARRELAAEIISERKVTAALVRAAREKVIARVMSIDPDELSARDVITWAEVLSKLSRQAHGDVEAHKVEITGKDGGPIEVAAEMPAEERNEILRRIESALAARARAALPAPEPESPDILEAEIVEDGDGVEGDGPGR